MSLSGSWELRIRERVYKTLGHLPKKDRERITEAIEGMRTNPFQGDAEKMKGDESVWRRRIGSYRIRYEVFVKRRLVYVFRVERRTSATY